MTPLVTQILDIIGNRLALINTTNEYFIDVERIERARLEPFRNQDMPAINYYSTGDGLVKPIHAGVSERSVSIVIEIYELTRDEIFSDLSDKLSTDVMIALERATTAPLVSDVVSTRLGDKIMSLLFSSITPAISGGQEPYCGAILVVDVVYRVDKNDPFVLIN